MDENVMQRVPLAIIAEIPMVTPTILRASANPMALADERSAPMPTAGHRWTERIARALTAGRR